MTNALPEGKDCRQGEDIGGQLSSRTHRPYQPLLARLKPAKAAGANKRTAPDLERFPLKPSNPITRPFAPHLVALASNSSASTLHMELLKLPFSFQ